MWLAVGVSVCVLVEAVLRLALHRTIAEVDTEPTPDGLAEVQAGLVSFANEIAFERTETYLLTADEDTRHFKRRDADERHELVLLCASFVASVSTYIRTQQDEDAVRAGTLFSTFLHQVGPGGLLTRWQELLFAYPRIPEGSYVN